MDKLLKIVSDRAKVMSHSVTKQLYYVVGPAQFKREYLALDMLGSLGKHGHGTPQLCFNRSVHDGKLVCTPTYVRRDGYPMYHGKQELRGKLLRREIRKMCDTHAEFPPHVADRIINFLNTLVG